MHTPEEGHWRAAKQVLRYLAGTADIGFCFGGGGGLAGGCDADIGSDVETRRSTTGWLFCWNGEAVSWCSRRQPTVSTSTAEAEYLAAATKTRQALWFRKIFPDLGEPVETIRIGEHNQSCLAMIANREGTGRAKQKDVAHHMERESVVRGEVALYHPLTAEMAADGFTKPLPATDFATFRDLVSVRAPHEAA